MKYISIAWVKWQGKYISIAWVRWQGKANLQWEFSGALSVLDSLSLGLFLFISDTILCSSTNLLFPKDCFHLATNKNFKNKEEEKKIKAPKTLTVQYIANYRQWHDIGQIYLTPKPMHARPSVSGYPKMHTSRGRIIIRGKIYSF